jgi:hypothetical protein
MGNFDEEAKRIKEVVMIQTIPTAGGVQLAILPYGFPYEDEINGEIDGKFIIYEYTKVPEDLKKKYLEAKSNIKIASSLDGLSGKGGGGLLL